MIDEERGGEKWDYEDSPQYWAQREMEQNIINEELERYFKYGS